MQPTAQDIEKRGYIEGPGGARYAVGSPEATNYLISQSKLPPTLPTQQTSGTELLDFKDIVSKATNLAKEKRNAMSVEFMAPHRGTVAASDFNGVLSNLNKASDTFAQDAIKNKLESEDTLKSEVIGGFEVLRSGGGKVVATRSLPNPTSPSTIPPTPTKVPAPGAPTWEQYLKAAEDVAGINYEPTAEPYKELKKQYEAAYTNTVATEPFTKTEVKKLEQAGLLNKPRQEQLDYLYKKKKTASEETEMSDEELMQFLRGE